jgi:hypothetical protein
MDKIEYHWLSSFNMEKNHSPIQNPIIKVPNWILRLDVGEFKTWQTQQIDIILFFDRASQSNLGAAGVGGTICDPGGQPIMSYAWGLGSMTNNEWRNMLFM